MQENNIEIGLVVHFKAAQLAVADNRETGFAALTVVFGVWPILLSIQVSLTASATALRPEPSYVGLANYVSVMTDPVFLASLWRTLLYTVLAVVANVGFALGYALLLSSRAITRGATFFKVAMFLPVVTPDVASRAETMNADGLTAVFVAEGRELRGILAVRDEIRPEAPRALTMLREQGVDEPFVLTGDHEAVARRLARDLRIPPGLVRAELLPEDKYEHLRELEQNGRRVCYVGDGTNDGPALAVASVGVSIGSAIVDARGGIQKPPPVLFWAPVAMSESIALRGVMASQDLLRSRSTDHPRPVSTGPRAR